MTTPTPSEHWHLDRRVPIALILSLVIQTSAIIWWASSINERVATNSQKVAILDTRTENMRGVAQEQAVQLGRIEEQIGGLRSDIGRLIVTIERGRP
jgi:hypothetical protein